MLLDLLLGVLNVLVLSLNISFFILQLRFSFLQLFLHLGVLGLNVFNVVVKLLDFILADLVLLCFQLFLLGKLVLVGLTKCIDFINPLFEFIDLMVSERFLGVCLSLSFVDLGHVLLLKINHFFVQLLALLFLVLQSFFQGIDLHSCLFQIFLVFFKVLVQSISGALVLLFSFIQDFLSVSNFTFQMGDLSLCLCEVLSSCGVVVLGGFQFRLEPFYFSF